VESNGPAIARAALGPLRRLVSGADRGRPPIRRRFFRYAAPVGLLGLLGLGLVTAQSLQDARHLRQAVATLLAIGVVLPIALAFRRPLLAWRIAYPMMFLGVWRAESVDWPWDPVQLLAIVVVFIAVAVTEDSGVIAWTIGLGLVPVFLFAAPTTAWGSAVLLVAIGLFGDVQSRRRQNQRQLVEQAEVNERERGRRAVLEERARIAREMHDVVAHHMSMIAVQAETAPFRVTGLPVDARDEFAAIATAARGALTDMRRLLGVLRTGDSEAELAPQPGLADLPALVATASRAGVAVTVTLPAQPDLPPAVGLAAYRIVQEALANAARHAPGGAIHIDGRGFADRLELSVRSELTRPVAPDGRGHGLAGMRERAALLGGTLSAGPSGQGDYVVSAVLPFASEQP